MFEMRKSADVKSGDKWIRRIEIIGSTETVFEVYEPTTGVMAGDHSSITRIGDQWYGRLGTRRLTPELAALPAMSDERIAAVDAFHAEQYEEAYRLICSIFPEARTGRRSMGEISVRSGERILQSR